MRYVLCNVCIQICYLRKSRTDSLSFIFHNEHFLRHFFFPFSANDKRLRNVNGVTNPNGGAVPPPVQRTPLSDPDMDNESLDNSRNSENEGYMREVKAIIGGVLGKERIIK